MNPIRKAWYNLRYSRVLIVKHLDNDNQTIHLIGRGWVLDRNSAQASGPFLAYDGRVAIEDFQEVPSLTRSDHYHLLSWKNVAYYERTSDGLYLVLSVALNMADAPQNNQRFKVVWVSEKDWQQAGYRPARKAERQSRSEDRLFPASNTQ